MACLLPLQAKALQQHIKASGIQVDVVIASPLKRALQTAVGCFGNHSSKPSNGTPPLMLEYVEQQGKVTAHPAVSAEGCPPFVCYELCREHLGVHPCDKRSSVSELAAEYPGERWIYVVLVWYRGCRRFTGKVLSVLMTIVEGAVATACPCAEQGSGFLGIWPQQWELTAAALAAGHLELRSTARFVLLAAQRCC